MRALRMAPAVLIAALLVGLGLAFAQTPDCTTSQCLYLPLMVKPEDTPTPTLTPSATPTNTPIPPTATPMLPPPTFNNCQADPNPGAAPNYPVRIVTVFKAGFPEVVRLQNTSTSSVNMDGWRMCSIKGPQEHTGIGGMLGPGETRDYPYTGVGFIWNNTERDDGALYTPDGRLASYWIDQ